MPAIPTRYRQPSHSLRNGGQPLKPGSRPSMPPASFWTYARDRQQDRTNPSGQSSPLKVWKDSKPSRPRTGSGSDGHQANPFGDSAILNPLGKATLVTNMSKGNMMQPRNPSYESIRKDEHHDTSSY
ncbi:hypothetical protein ACLMJK_001378 [Lecanora helva]